MRTPIVIMMSEVKNRGGSITWVLGIVLFLMTGNVCAQSYRVSGYVREFETGEVVAGASISGEDGGTTSNFSGYYSFQAKQAQTLLLCSFLGYSTFSVSLTLTSDTVIDIYLKSKVIQLDEVKVVQNTKMISATSTGNITVNTKQLKYMPSLLGEQDVFKFLQILPGVSAGREGSSGLNIRGSGSDQTLILLDDVPVYNQNHAFGFVSVFNGDALSTAELYKGFIPAFYGGRLSGVASLRMRDGNKYTHHQSINVSTISLSLSAEGPIKREKGSYFFSVRRFIPDLFLRGIYAATDVGDVTENLYTFYDITGKLNYTLNRKNTLFASFYMGQDKVILSEKDRWMFAGAKPDVISESGGGFEWGNITSSLRLNTILGDKIFMNNVLYYSQVKNKKSNYNKNYELLTQSSSETVSMLREVGLRSYFQHKVGVRHELQYGMNVSRQQVMPENIVYNNNSVEVREKAPTSELTTGSLFAEDRFSVGEYHFNVGGRLTLYAHKKNMAFAFEPRLSVNRQIAPGNLMWLSYSRNSQALFSAYRFYMGFPVDFWMPFNGKRVQTSDVLSWGWKNDVVKNLSLSVELYGKKMNHLMVIYDSDEFLSNGEGYDKASGWAYGAEILLQYSTPRFSGMASYTYSNSSRKVDGKRYPFLFDIPHDFKFFGKLTTRQRGRKAQFLSLNVAYRSGLPYILANEEYPGLNIVDSDYLLEQDNDIQHNGNYPNYRLKSYFRTDFSYSFEKTKRRGVRTWQVSFLNITNYMNPYMVFREGGKYKSMTLIPFMPAISFKRTF